MTQARSFRLAPLSISFLDDAERDRTIPVQVSFDIGDGWTNMHLVARAQDAREIAEFEPDHPFRRAFSRSIETIVRTALPDFDFTTSFPFREVDALAPHIGARPTLCFALDPIWKPGLLQVSSHQIIEMNAEAQRLGLAIPTPRGPMDKIIESAVNEDFLSEARARGYRPYVDQTCAADTPKDFYLGSVQRRITDAQGTRYFINIRMFDLSVIGSPVQEKLSAQVDCQFYRTDGLDQTADVSLHFEDFEAAEDFLDEIWRKMKFGYYERD